MTLKDSRGKTVTIRTVLDTLRDEFVVAVDDTKVDLDAACAAFDRAVSETLLDLLDARTPQRPPHVRQRALRSDAGKPKGPRAVASTPAADPIATAGEPMVARPARPPRQRRRKSLTTPPTTEELQALDETMRAEQAASIADTVGNPEDQIQ